MSLSSNSTGEHISSIQKPTSKYNVLSNGLRQITPGSFVCSMFCGGKGCKFDNPSKWSDKQMAIKGLYSSWVTENVLATSRPSTEAIEKYDIIMQFKKAGLSSIINLQIVGEHASCGNPLESSGFSYEPQIFMDNDIFFYNFCWHDYGVRSLVLLLDMVKVMDFAVEEGKVAVHCHAGLGRTGVLIACYLIFCRRMDADNAIHYVREKRTGAIQTKGQVECCQQFAQFLIPLRVVFASCDPCAFPFTLNQYLNRQRYILHGFEQRRLKHIPKIVSVVCQRLLQLAMCTPVNSLYVDENYAILLRQLQPKASAETRNNSIDDDDDVTKDTRTQDDTDAMQKTRRLPPLKKLSKRSSSSLEDVFQKQKLTYDIDSNDALKMRHQHQRMKDRNYHSSNIDEELNGASRGKRSKKKQHRSTTSISSQSSLVFRRSQYILSDFDNGDNDGCIDEVFVVTKALAFDIDYNLDTDDAEKLFVVQGLKQRVDSFQMNLNAQNNTWNILATEEDPYVLCSLMWSWLHHLKEPVLSSDDVEYLCGTIDDPDLDNLTKGLKSTLLCIINVVVCLQPLSRKLEVAILCRIIYGLTQVKDSGENHHLFYIRFVEFLMELSRSLQTTVATDRHSCQGDIIGASDSSSEGTNKKGEKVESSDEATNQEQYAAIANKTKAGVGKRVHLSTKLPLGLF